MDAEKKKPEAICPGKKLDLETVRTQLSQATGPRYWRTLEELTQAEGFEELLQREFPRGASEWLDPVTRRGFLKLMGASLALAGLGACVKQPLEPIVPYVRQPEQITLGKPLFYATQFPLSGYAAPILVESHEGRPTKIEGNPDHPAFLTSGTDAFTQASILTLYDPDRSPTNTYLGDVRPFPAFQVAIRGPLMAERAVNGAGLRFLTQTVSSPTLAAQLSALRRRYPAAKWHQWEPANRDSARNGARMAFGRVVDTQYRLEQADVILSLDADFLCGGFPGFARYARDYAQRRRPDERPMNRLYVIESSPTTTGGKADHRLPVRASEVEQYARAIASGIGINAGGRVNNDRDRRWVAALVKDLQAHRGRCVMIAGETQPPIVHALAHAMNDALANVGQTVLYTDPAEANPVDQGASLKDLVNDLNTNQVDVLVIVGGNPVYDAPAELDFATAMGKAPLRIHLGLYQNETAARCQWHVNEAFYLEGWSDARAYDGTAGIIQPLIAPLYNGKTAHEFLAAFGDQPEATAYDLVRGYWMTQPQGPDFEQWWRKSVHDGFMAGTASPPQPVKLTMTSFAPAAEANPPAADELEIVFRRDPSIYDGRFANNGWLQELPKPMTQITWGSPLLLSPATAQRLQLKSEDLVDLELNGRHVQAAVWIQVGHPDNAATAFLGFGRTQAGRAGTAVGFSAYQVRTSDGLWFARGLKLRKTGSGFPLASTQGSQMIQGRHMVRGATLEEYQKDPAFANQVGFTPPRALTLYPNYQYKGYAWGMNIDLNSCVGCNACVVACQAENNIPVVGKMEVLRGRHMHWLRIDNYYEGDMANPRMFFQPIPCMQCEDAPCELVCPVGATVHTTEGLNDQVYNRCVGTRYCSNNCPYKVRRFNFLLFQDWNTPQYKMMRNPEVSIRSRGVMEKCTYCVQRISAGRIEAEEEDRLIRDGEVLTACQQACPAGAIIFGDINDPKSRATGLKANPRDYGVLADLNTRPRTTYLAAVRNPNPEVPEE
jgi:molybdopterin-containing oxidoreductase family iron-sulfur binding subunit